MPNAQGIGPLDLQSQYLSVTDQFLQLQSYSNLIQQQIPLNLPNADGLAFQIMTYQSQIKAIAAAFLDPLMSSYIGLLTAGTNFCMLWDALISNGLAWIAQAYDSQSSKETAVAALQGVSDEASRINQTAQLLAGDFRVRNNELQSSEKAFDTSLTTAITQMGAAAAATSKTIDDLKAQAAQDIANIVAGAERVGGAVAELGIGSLTTIRGGGKPDFAVDAIQAAETGAAETAQARADLRRHNQDLSNAYQTLANLNSLIAIAKVIQVQNAMFASAMNEALKGLGQLVAIWGQSPITPPGSGISLEFATFAQQVQQVTTQSAATSLVAALRNVDTSWKSLKQELSQLTASLSG
jgi:hypothetical protein